MLARETHCDLVLRRVVDGLPQGQPDDLRLVPDVQHPEGVVFHDEIEFSVVGRDREIARRDGDSVADVDDRIHPERSPVLGAERIPDPEDVSILEGHQPLLRADGRRLVVVEFQGGMPRLPVGHLEVQRAVAARESRAQFRVHAGHAGILLEELQPFLYGVHVHRRPGAQGEPALKPARAEPLGPFHVHSA